jgi:TetR/AcrR family transcriptional repressor of mexJK operon
LDWTVQYDFRMSEETRTDTRARILQAALDTFSEKGYAASVDDIARRAGVVKQTLYHHFGSKEELFREAFTGMCTMLVVDAASSSGSVRMDVQRFVEAFESRVLSEEGLAFHRVMMSELQRFPELARTLHESWQVAQNRLARLLQAGMERGELRAEPAEFAAEVLISLLTGVHRGRLMGKPLHQSQLTPAQIVDVFMRAFAPDAKAATPDAPIHP